MRFVFGLDQIDQTQRSIVGAKAATLARLSRVDGIAVPAGCCVTTEAFRQIVANTNTPAVRDGLDRLTRLGSDDGDAIRSVAEQLRSALETITLLESLIAQLDDALQRLGADGSYAVRSSATAEDLPTASFAGQHESYLNVAGLTEILRHVRLCWASLYTDPAVNYRMRNGIDHRTVEMAVLVQRMVIADAAGVLFTADPVSGDRRVVCLEATRGLGEALVGGAVNPDAYRIRDGAITHRTSAAEPALTDGQAIRLARLGRRIEAQLGRPQDVEWCLAGGQFQVVQSRPITTLFPVPAAGDGQNHVYVSVGHQQMMTDAMMPLGLSMWQLTTPRPMAEAGGRLFVDVTAALAAPATRDSLLATFGRADPLVRDALLGVLARDDLVRTDSDEPPTGARATEAAADEPTADPATVVRLIEQTRASVAALADEIGPKSGTDLFDFILADLKELKRILFDPRSHQLIMAGMEAAWWLDDHLLEWLGEPDAADVLTRSVPHDVSAEMGLALLDLADAIRPHPQVVAFLRQAADGGRTSADFLATMAKLPGGVDARAAFARFLDSYGMRCAGEIDITRPRWSEQPTALVPAILTNIDSFEPGEATRRFERGCQAAAAGERQLLERVHALPDGDRKAIETKRVIDRLRTVAGFREFPKYGMISRYLHYKQALLAEAERLVATGTLPDPVDVFYLRFEEFHELVRTGTLDHDLLRRRTQEFRSYRALRPPRVLTSNGEMLNGADRPGDLPAGALPGLTVCSGTVEGRARVVLDMARADLVPGDILVTAYTDPSWTPVFVAIAGLVTEVGGRMTHGAVIAREYGLPALVGVDNATRLIRDGQRIRVHATAGYVELLP